MPSCISRKAGNRNQSAHSWEPSNPPHPPQFLLSHILEWSTILPIPSPRRGHSLSFSLPLLFSLFLSPPSFCSPLGPVLVFPFSDSPLQSPTNQSWTSGLFCGVGSGRRSRTRRDTLHTGPGGRRGVGHTHVTRSLPHCRATTPVPTAEFTG